MLSPNVIIVWPSTAASIPAGFTRETSLDGKFPKGTANATNPGTTGGSATHTHTSPNHNHTLNAHTHTYTLNDPGVSGIGSSGGGNGQALDGGHYHTGTTGTSSGGTTADTAVTYAAYSSEPPYYEVIFIKATGYAAVPAGSIVFWGKTTTEPQNFQICDGTNGTPDLRNKYLKGTTGSTSGTTGGQLTNTHTIAHGHTANTHTHVSAASGTPQGNGGANNNSSGAFTLVTTWHTHSITGDAASQAVTDFGGTLATQAETVEPAYTKLNAIKNIGAGGQICQPGIIAMWLGTLATIPIGWVLCDGSNSTPDMRDRHLKLSNTLSELANTGGSNTHTHAAQSHSHVGSGTHTHGLSGTGHVGECRQDGSGAQPRPATMVHTSVSVTAGTADYASANTTADSANNEPAYITVAYIMYKFSVGGGALFAIL